jgi:non-ribosomal peptide synthetase component E (peptide arylation enzyme)
VFRAEAREHPGVSDIRRFLAQSLASYELPLEIESRAALPRTAVGKIAKEELRRGI